MGRDIFLYENSIGFHFFIIRIIQKYGRTFSLLTEAVHFSHFDYKTFKVLRVGSHPNTHHYHARYSNTLLTEQIKKAPLGTSLICSRRWTGSEL